MCDNSSLRIPLAGAHTWGTDAYQRFDFRAISERLEDDKDADGTVAAPTDEEIEAAEREHTIRSAALGTCHLMSPHNLWSSQVD